MLVRFNLAACNWTAKDEVWSTAESLSGTPLLLGLGKLPGIGGGWGGDGLDIPGGGGGGMGAGGADDVRWWPEDWTVGCTGDPVSNPFAVVITK